MATQPAPVTAATAETERRVAVVTGGGSGIGRATAARLATEGFRVAVIDIDAEAAAGAAGEAGIGIGADVAEPVHVERAIRQVIDSFDHIDVLVNNAGISGSAAATVCHETPVEEWDRVFAVNARGAFLCARATLPDMVRRGHGHVITVASTAGLVAFPGRCAYTASKGAALQLTRSLAVDYAGAGIRANAVCPGFVQTPMTQWRLDVPELRARVEANIPLGRVAQPDEIAEAIVLLASDRLAYVTGHAFVIDGGWTAR
jgi:NAD(P)-dependent dehydrogenase (short-subunit alcohol dehydrogenase family)